MTKVIESGCSQRGKEGQGHESVFAFEIVTKQALEGKKRSKNHRIQEGILNRITLERLLRWPGKFAVLATSHRCQ
jgi:hypothetical protein